MHIKKPKIKKKLLVILLFLLIAAIVAVLVYLSTPRQNDSEKNLGSDLSKIESTDEKSAKNRSVSQRVDNPTPSSSVYNKDTPLDKVPQNSVVVSITLLEQRSGVVTLQGSANPATEKGTCVATFTNSNDKPIVKQVQATFDNQTATCASVNVPSNEFGALGEWQVSLRFFDSKGQSEAIKTINIVE